MKVYKSVGNQIDDVWQMTVTSGILLGHIVSQEGIIVDPDKMKAIIEAPTSKNAKALNRFLGQI